MKFREAYARGVPLVRYDRLGPGATAYREAAETILGLRERAAGGPTREPRPDDPPVRWFDPVGPAVPAEVAGRHSRPRSPNRAGG